MRVRFTKTVRFETEGRNTGPLFEAGSIHDLRDDLAQRWINRQVAEIAPAEVVEVVVPVVPAIPIAAKPGRHTAKP